MSYLFSKCETQPDGRVYLPSWAVERWKRQLTTPYADLSEEEKATDRQEADCILEVIYEAMRRP